MVSRKFAPTWHPKLCKFPCFLLPAIRGGPKWLASGILDELVVLALVRYGRYVDPVTGRPCAPERLVEHLADLRRRRWPSRRARLWQHISWAARKAGL
jgi:hypothetical protein